MQFSSDPNLKIPAKWIDIILQLNWAKELAARVLELSLQRDSAKFPEFYDRLQRFFNVL